MNFSDLYINKSNSLLIKAGKDCIFKCWFSGKLEPNSLNENYMHFVTFSKNCFSDNDNQEYISIMVNPKAKLPEWKILINKSIMDIKNTIEFDIDLELKEEPNEYSKIGGKPYYINSGQAYQFEHIVKQNKLEFIMQISEEDFFPIKSSNIDKQIRDCLCGGVIYIFGKINLEKNVIDFSNVLIDHHI